MPCTGDCAQGRTSCPHPVQCSGGRIERTLTDWGVLADDRYSEPDDLDLPKLTTVERALLVLILLLGFFGFGALIVSCTPN
jgi:hypothetical protein